MDSETRNQSKKSEIIKILLAVPLSLMIFSVLLAALLIGFEVVYADRVYPGVYVLDVDLSGLTLRESEQVLSGVMSYTTEGSIKFTYQNLAWEFRPIDLGYYVDPTASAQQALDVGRSHWFLNNFVEKGRAWFEGKQLSPVVYYDERMAQSTLQSIAAEIDQPVVEASLALENTDVIVKNGQVGKELDITSTLDTLSEFFIKMESADIVLDVEETAPSILDARPQADLAREMLSEPLVLVAGGTDEEDNAWTIPTKDLAEMLIIARIENDGFENSSFHITFNEELLGAYLTSLATEVYVAPANTRFMFNDDTFELEVIEPAVIGRNLDTEASIEHIIDQLQAGIHEIDLQFEVLEPAVTDEMTGEALGITENVETRTTYFYGSEAARIQNISIASAQFHGLLVAPGEAFSMAEALGDVSLENGYAEALIIYGDQTIQGVGGGVCQVSTTLFRTAFFAGFPIEERHAHAYRVGYYEFEYNGSKNSKWAGLDATVYVPIVDLKFTNDTDYWLLMETYVVGNSLTWKFYSTEDGRSVNWETTGLTNVVPAPEPLYRENPDLEKGEKIKVDYGADGADVTVTRIVYKEGVVYFSDMFRTHYQPWQEIWEYGPGTEDIPETDPE